MRANQQVQPITKMMLMVITKCFHFYDAYWRDLLDSVNSTLQPYGFPNLSSALLLKIILYDD